MIRLLFLFVASSLALHAVAPEDKFGLSVTGVVLKGNALEVTLKIANQSPGAVKIDLAAEALVFKADSQPPSLQAQSVATRADIYKPRIILLVPEGQSGFFPSKTSRVFAPQSLAPGAELSLSKTISITPSAFTVDAKRKPYRIFVNLAFRTGDGLDCQTTASSPTYQITSNADGTFSVIPDPPASP